MNTATYNVLWVDEGKDISNLVNQARKYNLRILQYFDWDSAKEALEEDFDYWSAVILDDNCVISPSQETSPDFLYQAVKELEIVFERNNVSLPWYILASGNMVDYEKTIQRVSMGAREHQVKHWGKVDYNKCQPNDIHALLGNIKQASSQQNINRVRRMYGGVFSTIHHYFDHQAEEVMLTILCALHFPEENRKFDPVTYYTQLRRILEYLFRTAYNFGLLPEEMFVGDKVNLTNASSYMAGLEVMVGNHKLVRFGKPSDSIFPPIIAGIVKKVINIANKQTHTSDITNDERDILNEYYHLVKSSNMLFGYALQICDVITWFGDYLESHKNISVNKSMCRTVSREERFRRTPEEGFPRAEQSSPRPERRTPQNDIPKKNFHHRKFNSRGKNKPQKDDI